MKASCFTSALALSVLALPTLSEAQLELLYVGNNRAGTISVEVVRNIELHEGVRPFTMTRDGRKL